MTVDRCPGVLRPHPAADGAMVRIRVPGGQTTGPALGRLGAIADAYGSGVLQLTSRASLQIRGLPETLPEQLEQDIVAAGFLPAATHERVRNVVASPLTGLRGGAADLRPLVAALDHAIVAEPVLAGLSGRFLFGLDDGRGDVVDLEPDLTYRAVDADHGQVLVGGGSHGLSVASQDAVPTLIELALRFQVARAPAGVWRVRELPRWVERLPGLVRIPVSAAPEVLPLGVVGAHASVQVPLGFLSPGQLAAVCSAAGDRAVVVTPRRGLVIEGAAGRLPALSATGLVVEAGSPWTAISACVGAPWCAEGRIDTQSLVRSVATLDLAWPRTHVSGCERRCGAPTQGHRDLVAPSRAELLASRSLELTDA